MSFLDNATNPAMLCSLIGSFRSLNEDRPVLTLEMIDVLSSETT